MERLPTVMDQLSPHSLTHGAQLYAQPPLYCRLSDRSPDERIASRVAALETLGLLESTSVPVFEEAVQMAARLLDLPICILSIAGETTDVFKAAIGLSQLGVLNPIAKARQLPLSESFSANITDSEQICVLQTVRDQPAFGHYPLVRCYGIEAYAGVPLVTSTGCCIGALAIMDQQPHAFLQQEIALLELTARWAMSEYERNRLQTRSTAASTLPVLTFEPGRAPDSRPSAPIEVPPPTAIPALIDAVRLNLIGQLIQELRSPLTSVIGMASMLSREIYGPLTQKQREYTEIIRSSSQVLMSLVDDVIQLGAFEQNQLPLMPSSVDLELLGQQVLTGLEPVAEKRQQQLALTLEPGPRLWVLDQSKVRQMLHYLILSILQLAGESSLLRLHGSRRGDRLQLAIWLSNPWLGEGLPQSLVLLGHQFLGRSHPMPSAALALRSRLSSETAEPLLGFESIDQLARVPQHSRELLGLLLSRRLAELQGGSITLQGTLESGQRFVISLPSLASSAHLTEFTTS
jgi:signal transduction histidine kinase